MRKFGGQVNIFTHSNSAIFLVSFSLSSFFLPRLQSVVKVVDDHLAVVVVLVVVGADVAVFVFGGGDEGGGGRCSRGPRVRVAQAAESAATTGRAGIKI